LLRDKNLKTVFSCFHDALDSAPLSPTLTFSASLDEGTEERFKAVYGPDGRDSGCVVLMLVEEQPWVLPLFSLGRIEPSEAVRESLTPEIINAVLGRHVAGDWGEGSAAGRALICSVEALFLPDAEQAFADGGQPLISYFAVPSVGCESVRVVTSADRSSTAVFMPWE
jgi:hypothetical protein